MYQDGYVNRRDFFNYAKAEIKKFSNSDLIDKFTYDFRCYYSSEYTVIFYFFFILQLLTIKDESRIKESIYNIVNYADICFEIVQPEYHDIFVEQMSDIMNFLVRDNKFTLIKNYDDNFRNLIKDKYLNNNFIIYFGRLAINEIESVAKIFNNINFFKAEDLSKMADATFLFDRNYDRVFDKIEDPNNVGELWFNYGE